MNKDLLIVLLSVCCSIGKVHSQTTITYNDAEETICVYDLKDGRLTCDYRSYYNNGQIKSKGKLLNGVRTGHWTVWDSMGNKRMERLCINPYEYKRIFPPVSKEGAIPLLLENQYPLMLDSSGMIRYYLIKTEDAVLRHKYWRRLYPETNPTICSGNRLFKLLQQLISKGSIKAYSPIDDRFSTMVSADSVPIPTSNKISFELKEEFTFDMNRLLSNYRILGLCAMVYEQNSWKPLFWVYYPELRPYLVGESIGTAGHPTGAKNLEELFFYRDFSSVITKSTHNNPFDWPIEKAPYLSECQMKMQPILEELSIIEMENSLWINLTNVISPGQ